MKRFNIYHLRFFVLFVIFCFFLLSVFLFAEKVCPKCGRKYPDTDNFCAYCDAEDGGPVRLVKIQPQTRPAIVAEIKLSGDSVIITSTPEGAAVYLDGKYKANTPVTIYASPGSHTVKLTYPGYRDYTKRIRIESPIVPSAPSGAGVSVPSKPGFTYLGKNSQGYEEYRHNKTGIILIKIPAGEFWMGSPAGEGSDDEHPQHKVYLDEYYIGKYEVTNEQFEQFVRETGYKTDAEREGKGWTYEGGKWEERSNRNWRYYYSAGREKHPVVLVSYNDAKAFCDWAGLRLPTEAEWEKAARGNDGRKYPWGNEWDGNKCSSWDTDISLLKSKSGYVDMGAGRSTVPVGSFAEGVSPYGCYDMAGNVWEWCADWYGSDYYTVSPYKNPTGPSSGGSRVLRGGGWFYGSWDCRSADRNSLDPTYRYSRLGFRVASFP